MRHTRLLAFLVAAILVCSALSTVAAEPKPIAQWNDIRQDMELFKGALKQAVAYTVLNTYLPGYGVVFMFTAKDDDVAAVQKELERALQFIAPTISSLPPGEKISVVGYCDGFSVWELIYTSSATTSSDPKSWDVYFNKKK